MRQRSITGGMEQPGAAFLFGHALTKPDMGICSWAEGKQHHVQKLYSGTRHVERLEKCQELEHW